MFKKVVTMGEIMMRLSPPGHQRIVQTDSFDVIYGGGEANVAVSLAHFGLDSHFVTKLPANPLGQAALNHLRRFGVRTDFIVRGGERLGIYFCEHGASQRPSQVIYDRANSSIAGAMSDDFSWDDIFSGANWFHFTGITPALSEDAVFLTREAIKQAKKHKLTISCDLNYRKKLWSTDKARHVMSELMEDVDICIANEEDAEKVFGIASGSDVDKGELQLDNYQKVAEELIARFGFTYVGSHLRESYSASENGWQVILYDGKQMYSSKKYRIHIVDRVGGGDAFSAGIIYGFLMGKEIQEIIEFAAAASCLKHTVPGDFNMITVEEVEHLMKSSGSGRVRR